MRDTTAHRAAFEHSVSGTKREGIPKTYGLVEVRTSESNFNRLLYLGHRAVAPKGMIDLARERVRLGLPALHKHSTSDESCDQCQERNSTEGDTGDGTDGELGSWRRDRCGPGGFDERDAVG